MLPESRNRTYDGSTALVPGDLNDIQDCIAGDKHPIRSIVIPAAAFRVLSGAPTLGVGEWTGVGEIVAELIIPAGDTIESLTFGWNRGAAGTLTGKIGVRNLLTGAAGTVTSLFQRTTNGWVADVVSNADLVAAAVDVTPNDGVAYWVQINADNAANIIGGAVLKTKKL